MKREKKIPDKYDLTGKIFGRLKVIKYSHTNKQGRIWECLCQCGKTSYVSIGALNSGNTKSCGCIPSELTAKRNRENKKYKNKTEFKLKEKLRHMVQRCHKEYSDCYHDYGGRGIQVCDEWQDKEFGFENFYKWSMENGYKDGLTIDRIDNDGDYSPDNCRWIDAKKQANNKRNNVYVEIDGVTHTVSEWAEIKGLERKTLEWRVRKGWDKKDLFKPPRKCKGINY